MLQAPLSTNMSCPYLWISNLQFRCRLCSRSVGVIYTINPEIIQTKIQHWHLIFRSQLLFYPQFWFLWKYYYLLASKLYFLCTLLYIWMSLSSRSQRLLWLHHCVFQNTLVFVGIYKYFSFDIVGSNLKSEIAICFKLG